MSREFEEHEKVVETKLTWAISEFANYQKIKSFSPFTLIVPMIAIE